MTTKTITGQYAGAYYLRSPVTTLSIAAGGEVEGNSNYGVYTAHTATAAYTVANAGKVTGGTFGVLLIDGGSVANSGAIAGAQGVLIRGAAGTVDNSATIDGSAYGAVYLGHGGSVNNTGQLRGMTFGIQVTGAAGTVSNAGGIQIGNGAFDVAVELEHGGVFTNNGDIFGGNGVLVENGRGTVINHGFLIPGTTAATFGAIYLADGGLVTNSSTKSASAEIIGFTSAVKVAGVGTVINSSDILVDVLIDTSISVDLVGGGRLENEAGGLITGNTGVVLDAAGTVKNSGDILANTGAAVILNAAGTVDNFGGLISKNGYSVEFNSAGSTLIVEAGSTIVGEAWGGGGTADFAGGVGSFTTIAAGGAVSVAQPGTYPDATFAGFSTIEIAKAAKFTLTGTGDVTSGNLDVLGTLAVTGSLTVQAAISGTGTLALQAAGTTTFEKGANLAIARVFETGGTADFAAKSLTVSDTWTQTAGTISVGNGERAVFTGEGDRFSGTLTGNGTIEFAAGTDTLSNTTIAANVVISEAAVTLSGHVDLTKTMIVVGQPVEVAATGATLTGGGKVSLDQNGDASLGVDAGGSLINVDDTISGSGGVGGYYVSLINDAGGKIIGTGSLGLGIFAATFVNAGLVEGISSGGLAINLGVDNTGTLEANGGKLQVEGAITGSGEVLIARGGKAVFFDAVDQTVRFGFGGGTMALHTVTPFGGTIVGFSKTGATAIDFEEFDFGASTTATYSGTTSGGVLTLTEGRATASVTLVGNYTRVTFNIADDGTGMALVTASMAPGAAAHAMSTAMAAFAPASSAALTPATRDAVLHHPMLAVGRMSLS